MTLQEGHGCSGGPASKEIGAMFVEAATRVGFAYAASLAVLVVLLQVAA